MAFLEAFPYFPATISAIRDENSFTKTFELDVLTPWEYAAGGRCVIRLTDENGYKAARDYSMSSAPTSGKIEFTVLHEPFGEVSTWLHERTKPGDTVEISKPLGDLFTWNQDSPDDLLLIAGGIGIAPLIGILREHRLKDASTNIALLYSVKSPVLATFTGDLAESRPQEKIAITYTKSAPLGWLGDTGRITTEMIKPHLASRQLVYICGPTAFVDSLEHMLLHDLKVAPEAIRAERFG